MEVELGRTLVLRGDEDDDVCTGFGHTRDFSCRVAVAGWKCAPTNNEAFKPFIGFSSDEEK